MEPLLGRPLTEYIFADDRRQAAAQQFEQQLMQTEITQPAVLTTDLALTRMLGRIRRASRHGDGPQPRRVRRAGRRGRAVVRRRAGGGQRPRPRDGEPVDRRQRRHGGRVRPRSPRSSGSSAETDGYVVVANINSTSQAVIGGATDAVERAVAAFQAAGMNASRIPVSHAFHTAIVAPVSEPLKAALRRLDVRPPMLPIVSNVTGEFYPADADVDDRCWTCSAARSPRRSGSSTACAHCRRPVPGCSSRSAPRRRCMGSPRTSSATMRWRCSPTTRNMATSPPSTRRCAGCTPPA